MFTAPNYCCAAKCAKRSALIAIELVRFVIVTDGTCFSSSSVLLFLVSTGALYPGEFFQVPAPWRPHEYSLNFDEVFDFQCPDFLQRLDVVYLDARTPCEPGLCNARVTSDLAKYKATDGTTVFCQTVLLDDEIYPLRRFSTSLFEILFVYLNYS